MSTIDFTSIKLTSTRSSFTKRIKSLKKGDVGHIVNSLIKKGILIRLSNNRVQHICGSSKPNSFAKITEWQEPMIGLTNHSYEKIDRAYSVINHPYVLLTSRNRDCFIWIKKNQETSRYFEVSVEEMLDDLPENIVEELIFNLDIIDTKERTDDSEN